MNYTLYTSDGNIKNKKQYIDISYKRMNDHEICKTSDDLKSEL
jgi:translation initiation factor 2 alpha subunit (eIF-2alpha)